MNIEQKAKAYDKAFRIAQELYNNPNSSNIGKGYVCTVFPELKESEDEKTRKEIISALKYANYEGVYDKHLAWLERQGEQKPAMNIVETWKDMRLEVYQQASGNRHEPNYSDDTTKMFSLNDIDEIIEKMSEQNPTDKVEPKFKQGEWIVWKNKHYKVNYNGCGYELFDQNGLSTSWDYKTIEDNAHLWSVQDAKDGDVLYSQCCKLLWIYKDEKTCHVGSNLNYNSGSIVINKPVCIPTDVQPATKEQRDLLFQKMRESGYEWSSEHRKLIKIAK